MGKWTLAVFANHSFARKKSNLDICVDCGWCSHWLYIAIRDDSQKFYFNSSGLASNFSGGRMADEIESRFLFLVSSVCVRDMHGIRHGCAVSFHF